MVSSLVVHKQVAMRGRVRHLLAREGFVVDEAASWDAASCCLDSCAPGLLLTTPFLGNVDVLSSLVHQHRPESPAVIVIIPDDLAPLGARSLDRGADDFISESDISRDLLSHVHAVLRRCALDRPSALVFGDLEIDSRARAVRLRGETIELTRLEFDLLELFSRRPGAVYSYGEILEHVWGGTIGLRHATVTEHIRRIRDKLGDQAGDATGWLHSVRGVGYVFRP